MVYYGPSKGCQLCRRRRVKCDERRPICGHCARRKTRHPCQYRDTPTSDTVINLTKHDSGSLESWDDWTDHLPVVYWEPNDTISSSFQQQSLDGEFEALSYFFTNCVNPAREVHTPMFVESIYALYASSPPDSPLRLATLAVASACLEFYKTLVPQPESARRHWFRAVSATRNAILDPELARSDEVLAAIFMLDFYEGLMRRYVKLHSNAEMHQRAAMAVLHARGLPDASSDSSKRLFSSLRSKHVMFHFQTGRRVSDFDQMRFDSHQWPISRIDSVVVEMTNLFADITDYGFGYSDYSSGYYQRCVDIIHQLRTWRQTVPEAWEPCRIKPQSLHHSIVAAGTYNGLCDVYATHTVSQMMNFWRTMTIIALRLLGQLAPSAQYENIQAEIQDLVDGICASVPFNLGNRMSYYPDPAPLHFPSVPEWLKAKTDYVDASNQPTVRTEADHIRDAVFKGAWYIMTPLTTLLEMCHPPAGVEAPRLPPIKLRTGQLEWIEAQSWRAHQVTFVPWPYGKAPLGRGGSLSTAPTWGILAITQGEDEDGVD